MAGPWEDYAAPEQDGPWSDYGAKPKPGGLATHGLDAVPTDANRALWQQEAAQRRQQTDAKQAEVSKTYGGGSGVVGKVMDSIMGAAETGWALGSGAAGGLAAAWRHPFDDKAREELAGRMQYQPRTEMGQSMTRAAGQALWPLQGAMPELGRIGAAQAMRSSPLPKPPREPMTPEKVDIPRQMVESGVKVPPSMTNPNRGLLANILEGWGGKVATQQKASAMNVETFNKMAASDLGLPPGTAITKKNLQPILEQYGTLRKRIDALDKEPVVGPGGAPQSNLRGAYGQPRKDIRWLADDELRGAADKIASDQMKVWAQEKQKAPPEYQALMDTLRQPSLPPSYVQAKVRMLRAEASDNYKPGGNTQLANAQKATANALEDFLGRKIAGLGDQKLISEFRDMRTRTAKAYDYMDAANALGDVSAHAMAKLDEGQMTGNAKTIATAGSLYPKATQSTAQMGGYQPHSAVSAGAAGIEAMQGTPSGLATALEILAGRPAARAALLSDWGQKRWAIPQQAPSTPLGASLGAGAQSSPWALLTTPPRTEDR